MVSPRQPMAADLSLCEAQQPSKGAGFAAASANWNLLWLQQRYHWNVTLLLFLNIFYITSVCYHFNSFSGTKRFTVTHLPYTTATSATSPRAVTSSAPQPQLRLSVHPHEKDSLACSFTPHRISGSPLKQISGWFSLSESFLSPLLSLCFRWFTFHRPRSAASSSLLQNKVQPAAGPGLHRQYCTTLQYNYTYSVKTAQS